MKVIMINAIWCPGCIVMHKVWKNLEEKYSNIEYINLDYDMDEEEVKKYNPGKILPITIIENNGLEIKRFEGEKKLEEFIDVIEGIK